MPSTSRFRAGSVLGASLLLVLAQAVASPESTAPQAEASAAPASAPWIAAREIESAESVDPATRSARAHLREAAARFQLDQADLDALEHRDTFADRKSGARFVRFRQALRGAELIGKEIAVISNARGELLGITGRLASSAALRRAERLAAHATRSARAHVAELLGGEVRALPGRPDAPFEAFARAHGKAATARVRRVFFELDGQLVPAHQVVLDSSAVLVSALDGSTLQTRSLEHADAYSYRVFAHNDWDVRPHLPAGRDATPHPTATPSGYAPAFVEQQLITLQNAPFSRNDPWLPPGAISLSGNTALAYVDRAAPDGFDPAADLGVPSTGPGAFDYTYDPAQAPAASEAQSRAAATQAFFTTAFLHDFLYDSGFDESAGNTQASNFGRGGQGGDRLRVEAQDYALDDHSRAIVPPDGISPTLSFGVYRGRDGRLDRDGAVDTGLVAHEWGHVLAERLVGNGVGLGNGQGRAIGEGVADFLALLLTIHEEDVVQASNSQWRGTYPVGAYAASAHDGEGYYYGLRRAPYSTDMTRNGLRFSHVARGATLPVSAPMRASDPRDNALAHRAGEVWANTLHEAYVSLLNAHPFQEAQDRMKAYLVAGLRITPFEPTFTEAAEALRLAAAAWDPADAQRFSSAFARRGFGAGSQSPARSSTDLLGVQESTATGGLRIVTASLDDGAQTCDGDGVLDTGETGTLRITVENASDSHIGGQAVAVSSSTQNATASFPNGNTMYFASMPPRARATGTLRVALGSASFGATASFTANFAPYQVVPSAQAATVQFPVHYDEGLVAGTDGMSAAQSTLGMERDGTRVPFTPTRDANDEFAHLDAGPARGTRALVTPPLSVEGTLGVSFRMRHSLGTSESGEALDAAVVELSEDGVHFVDVSTLAAAPGYDGALAAGTANPLGPRAGYTGLSAGFPAFVTRSLSLGDGFVGKQVVLRVRVGAATAGESAYGFDLDDLAVTGIAGTPFAARIAETSDGTQCNQAPVADAGADATVAQFAGDPALGIPTRVTLSAAGSFDPDGNALSFAWTQLGGPMVQLDSTSQSVAQFDVPALGGDAQLVFQVAVSDGTDTRYDTVRITVRRDNRAPTALAQGPSAVDAGATVSLDGSLSSDPDGDALTYTWTQTTGPQIAATADGALLAFTAPAFATDTELGFTLVVSDGLAESAPSSVLVVVRGAPDEPDAAVPPAPDGGASTPDAGGGSSGQQPGTEPPGGGSSGAQGMPDLVDEDSGCSVSGSPGARAGFAGWSLLTALGLVLRRHRRRDRAQ